MALSAAQLDSIYQNVLFRPAEPAAIAFYANRTDVSDAQIRQQIELSQEAVVFTNPVVRLFETAFNRLPSQADLRFYGLELKGGFTTEQVANQLAASTEFTNRLTGGVVTATFVQTLYQDLLGRAASDAEVSYYTARSASQIINGLANSPESVQANAAKVITFVDSAAQGAPNVGDLDVQNAPSNAPTQPAQTFTLTANTDAPGAQSPASNTQGTSGNDVFIATDTTLTNGDTLVGGDGTDTLRVIASGSANVVPTLSSVERIEVQQFGSAQTETINLANSTGYTVLASAQGSGTVAFTGVATLAAAEAANTTNGAAVNGVLSINYNTSTVSGTTDTQTLALNSGRLNTFQVNGIETLAVTANTTGTQTSAVSQIVDTTVTGGAVVALKAITVAGSGAVSLGAQGTELLGALSNGVNTLTFDASASTGNVTGFFGAGTVTATGGAGNDKFVFETVAGGVFTTTLDTNDTVNGGAGTGDTITIAGTDFTAGAGATTFGLLNTKVTNVEVLEVNGPTAVVLDQNALTNTQITKILFNGTAGETVTNAISSETYAFGTTHTAGGNSAFTLAQGQQTLNLSLEGSSTANVTVGTVTVNGGNTVAIASSGSFAGDHNVTGLITANNTTVSLTGSHDVNLGTLQVTTNTAGNQGDTVNASSFTGKLTLVGSGANDLITVGTGGSLVTGSTGADAITLGSGRDQLRYDNAAGTANLTNGTGFSTTGDLDTITNFTAGTDKFLLATTVTGVNAVTVTGGTGTTVAADLATAANVFANGNNAAVVTINGGTNAGTYLVADQSSAAGTTGNNAFDAGADFTVKLVGTSGTLTANDFTKVAV